MPDVLDLIRADLRSVADPAAVPGKARFFQSRPGGYAEGDRFIGVSVPDQRRVARRHRRPRRSRRRPPCSARAGTRSG